MANVVKLSKYAAKKGAKSAKPAGKSAGKTAATKMAGSKDIDHFIKTAGLDTRREKEIGQHIGYR